MEPGSPVRRALSAIEGALRRERGVPMPAAEAALVGAAVAIWHLLRAPPAFFALPGAFNDDGVYLTLGKAIAEGEGYRSLHLAGAPVQVKYPPALPALLALLWRMFGDLERVALGARFLNVAAAGLSAALLWQLARRRLGLPPVLVAALCLVMLAMEETVQYWTLALSEPWHVLGWALALTLYERVRTLAAEPARPRRSLGLVLGAVLGVMALLRTQALVLLPALLVPLLADRRTRRAGVLAAAVACLPPAVWAVVHARLRAAGPFSRDPDELSYLSWLPWDRPAEWPEFLRSTLLANPGEYLPWLARYVAVHPVSRVVVVLFFVAAVAGAVLAARRHAALALSVALTTLTVLVWPFVQNRLAIPLLPFAGVLAALAVSALLARARGRAARWVTPAVSVLAVASMLWVLHRQIVLRRTAMAMLQANMAPKYPLAGDFLPRNSRSIALTAGWTNASARPDDVLLAAFPAAVYLWTGRRGLASTPSESQANYRLFAREGQFLAERVLRDGATVVVISFPRERLVFEVAAIYQRCPGTLRYAGSPTASGLPAFYRTAGDLSCLRAFLGPGP